MMTSGGLISSLTVSMVTPLITVTATPIQTTTSTQIIPTINIPSMSRVPTTTRSFITSISQERSDLGQTTAIETKAFSHSNSYLISSQSSLRIAEDYIKPTPLSSSLPPNYSLSTSVSSLQPPIVSSTKAAGGDSDVFSKLFLQGVPLLARIL